MIVYVFLIIDSFVSKDPYMSFGGVLLLGILWLILIFSRISIYKKDETKKSVRNMGNILMVTLAVILLWINNKENAQRVLHGNGKFEVKLFFENDTIVSDTSLVFIGKTSEYIFMRDRLNDLNKIYKLDKLLEIDQK